MCARNAPRRNHAIHLHRHPRPVLRRRNRAGVVVVRVAVILTGSVLTGLVLAAGIFIIGIEIIDGHEDIAV